jgi:hypothetical protein
MILLGAAFTRAPADSRYLCYTTAHNMHIPSLVMMIMLHEGCSVRGYCTAGLHTLCTRPPGYTLREVFPRSYARSLLTLPARSSAAACCQLGVSTSSSALFVCAGSSVDAAALALGRSLTAPMTLPLLSLYAEHPMPPSAYVEGNAVLRVMLASHLLLLFRHTCGYLHSERCYTVVDGFEAESVMMQPQPPPAPHIRYPPRCLPARPAFLWWMQDRNSSDVEKSLPR